MAFEVASVKLTKPGIFVQPNMFLDNGNAKPAGGLFRGSWPLALYIHFAYKLDQGQHDAVSAKLPKWATNQDYMIEAKAGGNPTKDQMRLMMQSLLADRFRLMVHFEIKEGPVLALTLAEPGKPGPKLIPHSEGPRCPDSFEMLKLPDFSKPPELPKPGTVWRQCGAGATVLGTSDGTEIGARDTTPGLIANDVYAYGFLAGEVDKPVVDRTGLKGTFDFTINLPPGMMSFFPKPPSPDDLPKGTFFIDALRKQLGLKLERSRGDVRTLVIDHIEQPSEN
jgi:uncharacterized protein (TIGR03435 family)